MWLAQITRWCTTVKFMIDESEGVERETPRIYQSRKILKKDVCVEWYDP